MAMEASTRNSFSRDDKSFKSMDKAVDESENGVSGGFDCNICLDTVQDPVVTLCGHLYCWPCIYKWIHHKDALHGRPDKQNPRCPVCKSEVSQKTVVPLYGPGQTTNHDIEEKAPSAGTVIPRRPPTPKYGVLRTPVQQLGRRGYQQHAPPPLAMPGRGGMTTETEISQSPTIGMLREMVSGRILGDLENPLSATTPNSYNLASISTQRARRQATQADKSLSKIYTFLVCCMILCLLLST